MVAYRVRGVIQNAATDVLSFLGLGDGFAKPASGASSIAVEAGSYVISTGAGHGLNLSNGPWTVTVTGAVQASADTDVSKGAAIRLANTAAGSSVTVATNADVYGGRWGILAEGRTSVSNAAAISSSQASAIAELGDGSFSISNSGTIRATGATALRDHTGSHAIFIGGIGAHNLKNSGTIDGGDVAGAYAILSSGVSSVDTLTNTGTIYGDVDLGGGNDSVSTLSKARIVGKVQLGAGNDTYAGGSASEAVVDGGGSDIVTFGAGGANTYFAVRDVATGGDGFDQIIGNGFTVFDAANAKATVKVNIDSVVHNSIAANAATGSETGTDSILSIERVKTGEGNDEIWGNKYSESFYAGGGDDIVKAGLGNDKVYGEAGNDSLNGGDGNDVISGGSDIDFMFGGLGNDLLDGDDGNDIAYGEAGDDVLNGGTGNNSLFGGDGDDTLNGGLDADRLNGGLGRDVLTGREGNDIFLIASTLESAAGTTTRDVITDFTIGEDVIDVSGIDARSTTASVNDVFTWIGMGAYTNSAGQLRYGYSNGATIIAGDTNGDGKSDFHIQLNGHTFLLDVDLVL